MALMMFQDELENQTLKSFGEILWVISRVGFFEPMSVNNKRAARLSSKGVRGIG
jgi:hypothetical protein